MPGDHRVSVEGVLELRSDGQVEFTVLHLHFLVEDEEVAVLGILIRALSEVVYWIVETLSKGDIVDLLTAARTRESLPVQRLHRIVEFLPSSSDILPVGIMVVAIRKRKAEVVVVARLSPGYTVDLKCNTLKA